MRIRIVGLDWNTLTLASSAARESSVRSDLSYAKCTNSCIVVDDASVTAADDVTVTVVYPATLPELALIVLVYTPGSVPAVNRPAGVIVPPPATMDQVGRNTKLLPAESLPWARYCRVVVTNRESGPAGVIVMVDSTGGGAITFTEALPEILPSVALTVLRKVPGVGPAVKSPALLIVPPLAATDQVGVIAKGSPRASLPSAVNCWLARAATLVSGETRMDASLAGSPRPAPRTPRTRSWKPGPARFCRMSGKGARLPSLVSS